MLQLIYLVTTYFKKSKNALSGRIIITVKEDISSKQIEMTEIENNRILSPRTDTQNIENTIRSVYGPQDNELFEEKNKVLWLCVC